MVGRDAEGDPGVADLPLRAHEPLRHRRLRDEEGAGYLFGREAAERAQGQRDLRLGRQGGVTTREDQAQPLVGDRLVHLLSRLEGRQQLRLAPQRLLAPDAVARAVARGDQQPGAGLGRNAVAWPALERDRNRFLKGVLGELEVAEDADQAREDAPPFGTKGALDLVQCSTTGLTSTEPPCRAAGIFEANSIASSRLSHSMR